LNAPAETVTVVAPNHTSSTAAASSPPTEKEWRQELTNRVRTYRAKRERANSSASDSQSALPFEQQSADEPQQDTSDYDFAESLDPPSLDEDQYEDPLQSTLAAAAARISMDDVDPGLAPSTSKRNRDETEHLVIDVSRPAEPEERPVAHPLASLIMPAESKLLPVADISSRRRAGLVDAACLTLAFACIFGLFAMLGGRLALAKMDAVIWGAVAALLYTQYFTLFTVMGGATLGMMLAGLRLVSFDGTAPKPTQLAWRSFGYLVSGGTVFMGFLSTLWDEDHLSWHDRISQTYITSAEAMLATEGHGTPPHAPHA